MQSGRSRAEAAKELVLLLTPFIILIVAFGYWGYIWVSAQNGGGGGDSYYYYYYTTTTRTPTFTSSPTFTTTPTTTTTTTTVPTTTTTPPVIIPVTHPVAPGRYEANLSRIVGANGTFTAPVEVQVPDLHVTIEIPAGVRCVVNGTPVTHISIERPHITPPPPPPTVEIAGPALNLGPSGAVFDKPIRIGIPFNTTVVTPGTPLSQVHIAYYDAHRGEWVPLKTDYLDFIHGIAYGWTTHFTIFGVLLTPAPTTTTTTTTTTLTTTPTTTSPTTTTTTTPTTTTTTTTTTTVTTTTPTKTTTTPTTTHTTTTTTTTLTTTPTTTSPTTTTVAKAHRGLIAVIIVVIVIILAAIPLLRTRRT